MASEQLFQTTEGQKTETLLYIVIDQSQVKGREGTSSLFESIILGLL